ncbi:MAG: hypothetical protein KZQ60_19255 [Candidatus Thiodiazotropha sp. (ex Lucinoma aequizonata)]|nr:hypothetical protein [Candidatus Thiodiazotropha sp. (ex Lucinoma aequizonata)]MCU7888697.1 hypothetical protein [Candidatus Thiodiazotropha sp. (ex Lucinoma aequizonata)]MCU7900363.1 hypothetical protein [Candidatus Thiodiazotropha sp. (ex Lucinoma aequizonata)]
MAKIWPIQDMIRLFETEMSLRSKRLTILLDFEIQDLFGPPKLTVEKKVLFLFERPGNGGLPFDP